MDFVEDIQNAIKSLTGHDLTSDDLQHARHDIISVLLAYIKQKEGIFNEKDRAIISFVISKAITLQEKSVKGDTDSQLLIRGILKLCDPPKMNQTGKKKTKPFMPIVKDLIENGETSPHFIRASKINYLMYELSF